MIIGIDASKAARNPRTGVENVVYELILNLKKIDKKNIYFLYTNKKLPKELTNQVNFVEKLTYFPRFWNKFFLGLSIWRNRPDVYLQPTDKIPWSAPQKSAVIIHDLAYKYFPKAYSKKEYATQIDSVKNAVRKAKKLICVSHSTLNDLVKYFPKAEKNAQVVLLGFDKNVFHPIPNPSYPQRIQDKYIISTGRLEEKKNTLRLIKAFLKLKNEKNIPHKLVLAGSPGFGYDEIYRFINQNESLMKDVILTGHIGHDRLPDMIAGADCFAFPTLYEGFGLSVLEAMACGVAVLSSNTSSIPEIVGDSGILVDPKNIDDIAAGIYNIVSDNELRKRLSQKATETADHFSWQETARETLNLLENL